MQEKMFNIVLLVFGFVGVTEDTSGAAKTVVFLCAIVLCVLIVVCAVNLVDFSERRGRPGRGPLGGTMRESGGLQSEARARAPRSEVSRCW